MTFTRLHSAARHVQKSWRWLVASVLLATLVLTVGVGELADAFGRIAIGWAMLAAGLTLLWLFLAGLNVWLLLRRRSPLPLATFLPVYLACWAASLVLPGQLGDVTLVVLLRRHGVPASSSGAAYLVDKTIGFSWLLLVAGYGVGLYAPFISGWWLLALPAGGLGATVLGVGILRRLPERFGPQVARAQQFADRLLAQLWTFRGDPGPLAVNASLTLVRWGLQTLMYGCAFRAFGFELGFEAAATIPTMSSLVGYLPVTIGGAGTMEWTAVALFRQLGATAATVTGVYLFFRALLLLIAGFCLINSRRSERSDTGGA